MMCIVLLAAPFHHRINRKAISAMYLHMEVSMFISSEKEIHN